VAVESLTGKKKPEPLPDATPAEGGAD